MNTRENLPEIVTTVPVDLSLRAIGETFGRFRLVDPRAQARLDASVKRYGQLSPVIALSGDKPPFELVDGFKRLCAIRVLGGAQTLRVLRLTMTPQAAKAAVLEINRTTCRVSDFEEALVLHALAHEDCLTQAEIGVLFNRDQSWVSRRVAIAEHLCDEAKELIRLGLLSVTAGRELMRMPRGIQPLVLETLQKHTMTSREVGRLVQKLLSSAKETWPEILRFPDEILAPVAKSVKASDSVTAASLVERLARLAAHCQTVKRDLSRSSVIMPTGSEAGDAGEHTIKVMTWTIKSIRHALTSANTEETPWPKS